MKRLFLSLLFCATFTGHALAIAPVQVCDSTGNKCLAPNADQSIPTTQLSLQGFNDSNAALGISGNFTGTAHAAPLWANYFQCRAYSDQAGAASGLQVQQSDDAGVSWTFSGSANVAANSSAAIARVTITGAPGTTLYRCSETNGTTAQGTNRLTSSFTAH